MLVVFFFFLPCYTKVLIFLLFSLFYLVFFSHATLLFSLLPFPLHFNSLPVSHLALVTVYTFAYKSEYTKFRKCSMCLAAGHRNHRPREMKSSAELNANSRPWKRLNWTLGRQIDCRELNAN